PIARNSTAPFWNGCASVSDSARNGLPDHRDRGIPLNGARLSCYASVHGQALPQNAKAMTQFITFSRTIVRLVAIVTLLGPVAGPNSTAAGINQKGLAVNLTFENLVGEQPNFDVQ